MGIFSFLHRKNESKNEVDISESEMKTHHTVKDEQRNCRRARALSSRFDFT